MTGSSGPAGHRLPRAQDPAHGHPGHARDLSRRGAALEPAERREFVDKAIRRGTRLKELIEQLLLAARFEQTSREPARPLVDAAALARDALTAARVAHPGRELVLVAREVLPVRAAPGVPEADRERIFERFTQLVSGATRRAGGVGLGLYIGRQLAGAQDGELVVCDPALGGAGVRFELRLPLTPIAHDPEPVAYATSRR